MIKNLRTHLSSITIVSCTSLSETLDIFGLRGILSWDTSDLDDGSHLGVISHLSNFICQCLAHQIHCSINHGGEQSRCRSLLSCIIRSSVTARDGGKTTLVFFLQPVCWHHVISRTGPHLVVSCTDTQSWHNKAVHRLVEVLCHADPLYQVLLLDRWASGQ